MSGQLNWRKLKAKASYQSASAKQAVLEKIDHTTWTHFKNARSFVTANSSMFQEAPVIQWNQLVEESDHLLSQLSRKVKGFMDDINGSPYRRCGEPATGPGLNPEARASMPWRYPGQRHPSSPAPTVIDEANSSFIRQFEGPGLMAKPALLKPLAVTGCRC